MTHTPKHEATDAMGMESQRDGGPLSEKSGELKPCPFCSEKPIIDHERGQWTVGCFRDKCTQGGVWFEGESREAVTSAWNRRATTQPAHEAGEVETWHTIVEWGAKTFGPVTVERLVERANEEMTELLANPSDVMEAADTIIVLVQYPGVIDAIQKKMVINRARQWNVRGDGTGYHVKEEARAALEDKAQGAQQ